MTLTRPTTRPACSIALRASTSVRPASDGISIADSTLGAIATTRPTPPVIGTPGGGCWTSTGACTASAGGDAGGTSLPLKSSTRDTVAPSVASAVSASVSGVPNRSGMIDCATSSASDSGASGVSPTVTVAVLSWNPAADARIVYVPTSSSESVWAVSPPIGRTASIGGASERLAVTRTVAGSRLVLVIWTVSVCVVATRNLWVSSIALTRSFQAWAVSGSPGLTSVAMRG